ncbi:MAG: twin transmembrane helix small protein [Alphaproteobacteria bacterium]|jgi:hypothetical protein|nr:twin transmembrane helix small protein [Alphaproteobacteria bacterium]MBT5390586.1 twin transmembrane helix small protein [Alphaproteobacteria bacterium]MBT5540313.1 twin transmembrane helix small protein [Alphaproteobacteria bacterium]MBT5655051.1 twin transmembrane helix small protein [Alphaproteobacteria bacterium]
MSQTLTIFLFIAMGAAFVALLVGLFTFFKGGEFNKKHGNQFMRWRILLQGLALILFTFLLLYAQRG